MLSMSGKDRTEQEKPSTQNGAVSSHSVIGQGMTVGGACETEGHVRVQGTVAGSVTANGLDVGESGLIEGDATVPSTEKKGQVFVVSGRVTGRVRAPIVDVKRTGIVLGGIEAEEATIHGTVEGGVDVRRRLMVGSTGVLTGEIRTDRFVMEDGGRVNGIVWMDRAALATEDEPVGAAAADTTADAVPGEDLADGPKAEPVAA